jgi:hypothetical protein
MATKFDKSTIFAQARKDPNFFHSKNISFWDITNITANI